MESETMLTPREKSPLLEAQICDIASHRTASPNLSRLSYSGPHLQKELPQWPRDLVENRRQGSSPRFVLLIQPTVNVALRSKLLSPFFRPAHTWRQYTNSFGQKTLKWAPSSGCKLPNYGRLPSSHRPEDLAWSSHWTEKNPALPGWINTCDSKIGTPVATLPGTWHYSIIDSTGWDSVSILWLGEKPTFGPQLLFECGNTKKNLYRSIPHIQFACCWDVQYPRNKTKPTTATCTLLAHGCSKQHDRLHGQTSESSN